MSGRILTFVQAVNEALLQAMENDPKVITFGLGVGDPKEIFGTTAGLQKKFGSQRVFDMPTSENAMTGVAIGASLQGYKPVMVHQRLDFFLLAMDQLINGAAKWHFMFGGQKSASIVIRLIIGRGWGQGPTHSQSLHAWFAHIPGLKVVMPTTPADAKALMLGAIEDPAPVIFLEHRWLHNAKGEVAEPALPAKLGKATVRRSGADVTIIAMGFLVVEALYAADFLHASGIHCEVIDLISINPIDWHCLMSSVEKTGRVLVLDTGALTGSVAGEIVARISEKYWDNLKSAPVRIAMPDIPEPTSFELTKDFYPRAENIVEAIRNMRGLPKFQGTVVRKASYPHDVPGDWFTGPF
jgi:pyruvate/2-oxoglutarate/acetoin dehydrogenase E1 component